MDNYQKSLIKEHSELVVRIAKLHNCVYGVSLEEDNKVEYANKCIQLAAMKKYEEALNARLTNANIVFEDGNYFEKVSTVCDCPDAKIEITIEHNCGSDYDADKEKLKQSNE